MRDGITVKLFVLGGLGLGFVVALVLVSLVVSERRRYRDQAVGEIAASTARSQVLCGPLLVVRVRDQAVPATRPGERRAEPLPWGDEVLLPESLEVRSEVRVEPRSRGIHRAHVYRSRNLLRGVFRVPPDLSLPAGKEIVAGEPVRLVVGVSDVRGLRTPPVVRWDGAALPLDAATGQGWLEAGFSAPIGAVPVRGREVPFEIEIELVGTERLGVVPVAALTTAEMTSSWPHPSFGGGFLPDARETGPDGFRASWRLSRHATGIGDLIGQRRAHPLSFEGRDFAVRFVQPVDVYLQSHRAVKYGVLFVMLTFLAFFLYEVLGRMHVHPVQYGLAGAAVALFFLLLVSLSEHVRFALAYVLASAACVGLLAFYVRHVLGSVARGLAFGALLAGLYAALYVLLQAEDYALLLGALLLFGILAAVMAATRRVDWYALGERERAAG